MHNPTVGENTAGRTPLPKSNFAIGGRRARMLRAMPTMKLHKILDYLRAAEETIHRFERRYGIASQQFFELYSADKLDDGEHTEDFSEWAGFYRLKLRREQALKDLSQERLRQLEATAPSGRIPLDPQESLVDAS